MTAETERESKRESENEEEFWGEEEKALRAVRKRYYATALLKNNEIKKVRKWLDDGDTITVSPDSRKTLYLLNTTLMDKRPDLFSRGIDKPQREIEKPQREI
jgi:hypothetical protein